MGALLRRRHAASRVQHLLIVSLMGCSQLLLLSSVRERAWPAAAAAAPPCTALARRALPTSTALPLLLLPLLFLLPLLLPGSCWHEGWRRGV